MADKENKTDLIESYKMHSTDTGSVEVQVALMTDRIKYITDHLRFHKKDNHSRMGLLKLVGKRRALLNYLTREDGERYSSLVIRLGLRR